MLFRQLFEPLSSTYTYVLGCEETGQAILIDPVVNRIDLDLHVLREMGLTLAYTLDTHIHADHVTAARHLKERVGSRIAAPAMERLPCADLGIVDGVPWQVGSARIEPIHTPGHTAGHFAYRVADRLFSGDALLVDGCGRTDLQSGDAATLYCSVHERLFTLPDDVLVYPAHDYQQRRVSTIGQEKARNPRLGGNRTREDFVALMARLNLPYPKFMDYAVPANRQCGVCPTDLPKRLRAHGELMKESAKG